MNSDLEELMQQASKLAKERQQEDDNNKHTIDVFDLSDIELNNIAPNEHSTFDICTYCGNTGKGIKGEIPCPECGRVYHIETLAVDPYPTYVNVPERYKDNDWDAEKAKDIPRIRLLDPKVQKNIPIWVNTLNQILMKAKDNMIFRDSYLISGPGGLAKTIWAFTFIKKLHKNNVRVSPILLLNEINAYGDEIKKYQVLVINVTRFNFSENIDKLDYILQKRKLLDLPTVVISSIPHSNFVSPADHSLIYFDEVITPL